MKYLLIIFLCSCTQKATIKYIIDGDTVISSTGDKIRLSNIDCPEATAGHFQPFGLQAKEYTRKYLEGRQVVLKTHGKDSYGRILADIYLQDGRYFNQMLVKSGLAYVYQRYAPDFLFKDEQAAKAAKIGLWASYSISPYQFRKQFKK